jgi:carbon monoxide dehydrogenase subunit G
VQFEKQVTIKAPIAEVWKFLWDVERLVSCIPGCVEAGTVEERKRYTARIREKIGPFKAEFPLEVEVLQVDEPRRLTARASGKDSMLASSMKVDLSVSLAESDEGGTSLGVTADVNILGKIGTLGHGVIKRRADEIIGQFADAIRQRLESGGNNQC